MKMRICAGVMTLGALLATAARGNILVNGGLESPAAPKMPDDLIYMSATQNTAALPGWTLAFGAVDVVPKTYWQSAQGNDSVDLVGTPGIGGIEQSFATAAGTSYVLTFDFAVNPQKGPVNVNGDTKQLEVSALAADGDTVLNSQVFQGTAGTRTVKNMQYETETFTFTATGTTSTLELQALAPLNMPDGLSASTIYTGPVIDNLDLEIGAGSPSPEPASIAVLGMSGLLLLRRRRKSAESSMA